MELNLHASSVAWRMHSARQADPKFLEYSLKIWERDAYTCQFCGFCSREYQEVINLDYDYHNNKFKNLVTSCCFCSQCFFLESVGVGGYGGGSLIYLPEFTQAELNSLCHVLFCAITNDTGYKNSAQSIYVDFKSRSAIIEKKFGEGSSNPSTFGYLLIESKIEDKEVHKKMLDGVRLLPSRAKFRKQIESFAVSAFKELVNKTGEAVHGESG
jgi:intracellular multiplication protein IcmJ